MALHPSTPKTPRHPPAAMGTVIGPGNELEGTFDIQHDIRIEGSLHGRLKTAGNLSIYPDGQVQADYVEAATAVIEGRFIGRLRTHRRVHLKSTCHFTGVIETPLLEVDAGAVIEYDPDI